MIIYRVSAVYFAFCLDVDLTIDPYLHTAISSHGRISTAASVMSHAIDLKLSLLDLFAADLLKQWHAGGCFF